MGFGILLDIFIYISAFYSLDLLDLRQTLDFNPHHDIELTATILAAYIGRKNGGSELKIRR